MTPSFHLPARGDHVGSFLRPKYLLEARDQRARGEITSEALRLVEDKAIVEIIQFQEDVGLKSITDGEFRRTYFHVDFLEQLGGVKSDIPFTVQKADGTAPHEILLVIDGNTGQNALSQVKAFDEALQLTGLVVTKLDGTAKGGVLAAIALWAKERQAASPSSRPVPVYFIGVGEQLDDLETFNAREFAQALLVG